MCKRLLMLTSLLLVLGLVCPNAAFGTTIEIRVAAGEDDSEEKVASGAIDLTSSDLEITEEGGPDANQLVGMRFNNVAIPQGSVINSAYVQFHVDEIEVPGDNRPGTKFLRGEAVDNAAAFTTAAFDISSRPTTSAEASWDWPEWLTVHEEGPDQQTSDISAVIQEIVDRPGWSSGNSLALIITGSGENCAEAFNGEADGAPLLHVEFGEDPFLQDGGPDGILSMEAENFHNKTKGQNDSEWVEVGPTGGFTGAAGMQVADGTEGTNNTNYAAESARLDFEVTFLKTGTHYVWVRAWGPDGSGDSCHAGLDGQEIDTCDRMSGWNANYRWSNDTMDNTPSTFEVTSGGAHVVNIWMREDGLVVDKIVLTTNPDYVPEGDGPPESARGLPVNAYAPDPPNGAIEVDTTTLAWTGADGAVLHRVYLSTDETIDETDLIAETEMTLIAVDLTPGTTYYWRVDEVTADGTVYEGSVWTFATIALEAHFPVPADGAESVAVDAKLSWTPGKVVVMHKLYFSTDEAAVAARDMGIFKGMLMQPQYDPGLLEPLTTYYWAVDQFTPTGDVAGPVWSFSTVKYVVIEDGPVTLNYDNTAEPYVSEVAIDTPMDITAGGVVSDLTVRIKGQPGNLSIDEATGTYEVAGAGADVWGSSDQFHYVYKELTGDGTITARVVSNGTGSNTWAKGGVMIRESTAPNSKHMIMALTGSDGGGICFQGRPSDGGNSSSLHGDITASPPYWVRLVREGNAITAYASADGVDWQLFTDTSPDNSGGPMSNPIDVAMADPVLIGLFVTSHASGEVRTYTMDNVSIEGNVSADFVSEDIGGDPSGNSAESVYVELEDMLGASAAVVHGNPAATQIPDWRQWTIPLSEFAGVDPTLAAKLYVGVGDGNPGGAGALSISEVRVVEPDMSDAIGSWQAAASADAPGFLATNVPLGVYDIGAYGGEQTYEFVVNANPDEDRPSMALIGRFMQDAGNRAALKFDQWNNTGEYGATLFGVVDLYYGVPANYGVNNHVAFVSSEAAGTTTLYVDGALAGTVDRAISLSGLVGIGGANRDLEGTGWVDPFDGDILCVAIYDAALSDAQIAAHADAFFVPVVDVTVPGDIVKGVPDDGDWPGNEHPALAIDNNVRTKYLHFKGASMATGIRVTPLDGPSVVTGLSLTTANDDYGRDPTSYELSGSNGSIDGPYELIAAGDIVDFAQAALWPRFTKNATPITFENGVAYKHYQLLFPSVSRPNNDGLMQIAEVELLGVAAK